MVCKTELEIAKKMTNLRVTIENGKTFYENGRRVSISFKIYIIITKPISFRSDMGAGGGWDLSLGQDLFLRIWPRTPISPSFPVGFEFPVQVGRPMAKTCPHKNSIGSWLRFKGKFLVLYY